MRRCTVPIAWEFNLLCHAPGRANGAGALCKTPASYLPTPTLSACRSSQACSSLTGISLRRPRRTSRMSGSICARQVSQDTPNASHACSTLSARMGVLRFWTAVAAAACGDIGAIADIDPNLLEPATQLRSTDAVASNRSPAAVARTARHRTPASPTVTERGVARARQPGGVRHASSTLPTVARTRSRACDRSTPAISRSSYSLSR